LGEPVGRISTSGAFSDVLQTAAERIGGRLLIILDQFEEYFLYHAQEDGPGSFAVEFPKAINNPALPVNFMISLREDALAKLDRFEGRIPYLFDNYLRIEHLDRESACDAIIQPIEQYNRMLEPGTPKMEIEPLLVEAVLEQVQTGKVILGEAGRGGVKGGDNKARVETPFLQLVMTRLWNEEMQAGSRVLRLETLNALGGAERIVKTHLDKAISNLAVEEQDAAAGIFHYLVTPSGTKIAHSLGDLAYYSGLKQDLLVPVVEELSSGETRILRSVAPPPDDPGPLRYEIFHDVLAPAILDWCGRYVKTQEQAEAERLLAVQAEERAKAEQELAREQRRARNQRLGLVVMALLLLGMIGMVVYASIKRDQARKAQTLVAAEKDRAEAALIEAEKARDETTEALGAKEKALGEKEEERRVAEEQRKKAKLAESEAEKQRRAAVKAKGAAELQTQLAQLRLVGLEEAISKITDPEVRASLTNKHLADSAGRRLNDSQEARLIAVVRSGSSPGAARARTPAHKGLKLWENGATLRVRFIGGSPAQHDRARKAAQEWERYANLHFEFGSDPNAEIRIAFDPSNGSWSYTGIDALIVPKSQPTMNLGFNDDASAFHEFGHVLGLIHENSNPNADIPWDKEQVYKDLAGPPSYWQKEAVDINIFRKDNVTDYRPFDPKSIMMYAFSSKWFTDGRKAEVNKVLSESDKKLAGKLYPRP
jgi:hypothetical protein